MNKEQILQSDVLDIIFEKRNKAYGAYNLRKFYGNRLVKSLGLMLSGVVLLSAFTFLPKKEKHVKVEVETKWVHLPPAEPKEKKKEPEKPKEQPKQQTAKAAPSQEFTKPVVVATNIPVAPITNLVDSLAISNVKVPATPGDVPVVTPVPPTTPGDGPVTPPVPPVVDVVTPRESAEVMPAYPGGMDALRKFLEKNLRNPRDMEEGEMVSVKVRFVVGYDGKLQSFVTVQDGGEEFNKEVVRVLKKMPEWIPGKSKGENVSVYYTIPVKFVPAE